MRSTLLRTTACVAVVLAGLALWLNHVRPIERDLSVMEAHESSNTPVAIEPDEEMVRNRAHSVEVKLGVAVTTVNVQNCIDSTPVTGATISISRPNGDKHSLVTESAGSAVYPATELTGGTVRLRAPGFREAQYELPSSVEQALFYYLCPSGSLRVRVSDEQGAPIPWAVISILPQELPKDTLDGMLSLWPNWYDEKVPTRTDMSGSCVLQDMPQGIALLITACNTSKQVVLPMGTTLSEVEIVVKTTSCIKGRLLWEDGKSVDQGLRVVSWESEDHSSPRADTVTDSLGRFVLCRVPTGRVAWSICHPGEYSRETTVKLGGTDVGDIRLKRAFECVGRVLSSAGCTSGLEVSAIQAGRVVGEPAVPEQDGTFVIQIPQGQCLVMVHSAKQAVAAVHAVSPFQSLDIDIADDLGAIRIDNLPVPAGEDVTVKLVSDKYESVSASERGVQTLIYETANPAHTAVWVDRSVRLECCPSGVLDIYATNTRDIWYCGQCIVEPGSLSVLDASLNPGHPIAIDVMDADGVPIPQIALEARFMIVSRIKAFSRKSSTSNESGRAMFDGLASGRWSIYPSREGPSSANAIALDVGAIRYGQIRLPKGGLHSLEGAVKRNGVPVNGVTVLVFAIGASMAPVPLSSARSRSSTDGKFRADQLLPGWYSVRAVQGVPGTPTYCMVSRRVYVGGTAPDFVELDLESSLVKVLLVEDGAPCGDRFDGGSVYTPDGVTSLQRMQASETEWWANIYRGPCVVKLKSKAVPRMRYAATTEHVVIAVSKQAEVRDGRITIEVGGCTIRAQLSSGFSTRPIARITSVNGFAGVDKLVGDSSLGFHDSPEFRQFSLVPVGSTIVLEYPDGAALFPRRETIHVESRTAIDVSW